MTIVFLNFLVLAQGEGGVPGNSALSTLYVHLNVCPFLSVHFPVFVTLRSSHTKMESTRPIHIGAEESDIESRERLLGDSTAAESEALFRRLQQRFCSAFAKVQKSTGPRPTEDGEENCAKTICMKVVVIAALSTVVGLGVVGLFGMPPVPCDGSRKGEGSRNAGPNSSSWRESSKACQGRAQGGEGGNHGQGSGG